MGLLIPTIIVDNNFKQISVKRVLVAYADIIKLSFS